MYDLIILFTDVNVGMLHLTSSYRESTSMVTVRYCTHTTKNTVRQCVSSEFRRNGCLSRKSTLSRVLAEIGMNVFKYRYDGILRIRHNIRLSHSQDAERICISRLLHMPDMSRRADSPFPIQTYDIHHKNEFFLHKKT